MHNPSSLHVQVGILVLATFHVVWATLSLNDVLKISDDCVAGRITMYDQSVTALGKDNKLAKELREAEQARYKAYIKSIDDNFLFHKCSVWSWTVEDFKKALVPASFFMKPDKKTQSPLAEKAVAEVEKAEKDIPIRAILNCVRRNIKTPLQPSSITAADADTFAQNFGGEGVSSDIENEALLSFLRTIRCSDRKFDENPTDPYEEIKQSFPRYLAGRLKDGFEATRDWVSCMLLMKGQSNIEFSDMWGCNGHWDIWDGPACLKRVRQQKPEVLQNLVEYDDDKFRNALRKDAKSAEHQALENSLDETKKMMLGMARRFYRNVICRWSKAHTNAKLVEAEAAKAGQPGRREKRGVKQCVISILASFAFAALLCCVGAGITSFQTACFSIATGPGSATIGFFVGLITGLFVTVLFKNCQ